MRYAPTNGLGWLFIDFNAYFASVEQHDDPALRGRPVIVAPLASEHTMAIAASYEARPFGIRRGTSVREARALCPDLAVRPARHDRYVEVHRLLMAEIARHLPIAKVCSIDEAACRLARAEGTREPALALARAMKRGLAKNVGPTLRASIGLAQSMLLAKLAAESEKPNGLTVLAPGDLPHQLEHIPLTDIPGVGRGVAARLARAGVDDFLTLWALQPKQARRIWGSVMGERFWYGLHGYDVHEPQTKKSMIGHSRVLARQHEAPERARLVARALVLKAASRLRHYGMHAGALSLAVRMRPNGDWDGVRRFAFSQDSFRFLEALDNMWVEFVIAAKRMHARARADGEDERVRPRCGAVTIHLHNLAAAGDTRLAQGDLFSLPDRREDDDRRARLWRAIDQINADPDARFRRLGAAPGRGPPTGRRYVALAGQNGLDLNYLGAKIAFSRVPDAAEFLY